MSHVPSTLTTHLLHLNPSAFKAATQTLFLSHAGAGTLSKVTLQRWLAQDRLYAQAYVRFAALLLANVKLEGKVEGGALGERLADMLVDSLVNIRRELKFFEDVAARYEMDINVTEENVSDGVRLYRDLFSAVGEALESGKVSILEALVVLWGTEKCYLEAWRYAASFSSAEKVVEEDADGGALRKEFIPNWTSDEFVMFVDTIGAFVDEFWTLDGTKEGVKGTGAPEGLWRRVLDVEREFWPVVDE